MGGQGRRVQIPRQSPWRSATSVPTPSALRLSLRQTHGEATEEQNARTAQQHTSVPLPLIPMHPPDVSITRKMGSCERGEPLQTHTQALPAPQHHSCHAAAALTRSYGRTGHPRVLPQTLVLVFGSGVSLSDLYPLCSRRSL